MCWKNLATKLVRSFTKLSFCFATGDVASRLVRSLARDWHVPWLLCYLRAGLDAIMKLVMGVQTIVNTVVYGLFFKVGLPEKKLLCFAAPLDSWCWLLYFSGRTWAFSPGRGPQKLASKQRQTSNACTCPPTHNFVEMTTGSRSNWEVLSYNWKLSSIQVQFGW